MRSSAGLLPELGNNWTWVRKGRKPEKRDCVSVELAETEEPGRIHSDGSYPELAESAARQGERLAALGYAATGSSA